MNQQDNRLEDLLSHFSFERNEDGTYSHEEFGDFNFFSLDPESVLRTIWKRAKNLGYKKAKDEARAMNHHSDRIAQLTRDLAKFSAKDLKVVSQIVLGLLRNAQDLYIPTVNDPSPWDLEGPRTILKPQPMEWKPPKEETIEFPIPLRHGDPLGKDARGPGSYRDFYRNSQTIALQEGVGKVFAYIDRFSGLQKMIFEHLKECYPKHKTAYIGFYFWVFYGFAFSVRGALGRKLTPADLRLEIEFSYMLERFSQNANTFKIWDSAKNLPGTKYLVAFLMGFVASEESAYKDQPKTIRWNSIPTVLERFTKIDSDRNSGPKPGYTYGEMLAIAFGRDLKTADVASVDRDFDELFKTDKPKP